MNRDAQGRLLDRQEGSPGPGGGIDLPSAPDRMAARLALLQQELTELSTRYTDRYPDVVAKKQENGDLEKQLANAPRRTGVTAIARAPRSAVNDARMTSLKAEEQRLLDSISSYQRRVEDMPKREQEFQEVARDYETTKELYKSLKQRYEEALLGENVEQQQ